ncbi:MAG TPA: hypothetical protein VMH40_09035 [Myxococcaceae bacterium]|nr:hypothetical protein [Myxococcaceae bacterium]
MKRARVAAGSGLILGFAAAMVAVARHFAADPWEPVAFPVSTLGATAATVALASLYEWIVHRHVYHRPSPVPLLQGIREMHHVARAL